MKQTSYIFKYLLVSPELIVILSGLAFYKFYPSCLASLSEKIGGNAEALKYFGLLPAILFAYDLKTVKVLLLPEADKKMILQHWPQYQNFRCGCMVGLVYGLFFAAFGITTLLFDWKLPAAYQSGILVTSVIGALTVSGTLYYANICMEEYFRQHSLSKPQD